MKYLHFVNGQEETMIESLYASDNKPRFSMECLANIKKGEYKIWDRETNELVIVELSAFFKEL
jgi:hypothetical protein